MKYSIDQYILSILLDTEDNSEATLENFEKFQLQSLLFNEETFIEFFKKKGHDAAKQEVIRQYFDKKLTDVELFAKLGDDFKRLFESDELFEYMNTKTDQFNQVIFMSAKPGEEKLDKINKYLSELKGLETKQNYTVIKGLNAINELLKSKSKEELGKELDQLIDDIAKSAPAAEPESVNIVDQSLPKDTSLEQKFAPQLHLGGTKGPQLVK